MKFYNRVLEKIPELLDLPDQTLPGVPIIEVYGDRRVLIEGRSTVIQYTENCMKLRNACGTVCVCGCGLKMAELSQQQLIITGKVESISISRG